MPRNKERTLDAYIGAKVRMRRLMLNMSQETLSGKLGVTFQQVQKYEKGLNRISASRLFELALALGVPVGYFYEGLEESAALAGVKLNQAFCVLMTIKCVAAYWLWLKISPASLVSRKPKGKHNLHLTQSICAAR